MLQAIETQRFPSHVVWLSVGHIIALVGNNGVNFTSRSFDGQMARLWQKCCCVLAASYGCAAIVKWDVFGHVAEGETAAKDGFNSVDFFTAPPAGDPRILGQRTSLQPPSSALCVICHGVYLRLCHFNALTRFIIHFSMMAVIIINCFSIYCSSAIIRRLGPPR